MKKNRLRYSKQKSGSTSPPNHEFWLITSGPTGKFIRQAVAAPADCKFGPIHSVLKAEKFDDRFHLTSVQLAGLVPDQQSLNRADVNVTEPDIMQKHAMALGYFFLAVFCIFTSSQGYLQLRVPLLVVSLLAALMGLGFLMSAWAAQFQTAWRWWLQLVRMGQQAPIAGRSLRPLND